MKFIIYFIKNFWQAVLICILIAILLVMCNTKGCDKPKSVIKKDTITKIYTEKIKILQDSVKFYKKIIAENKIRIKIMAADIGVLKATQIIYTEKIKNLPIDSAMILAGHNFSDKTIIEKIEIDGRIRLAIAPKQLSEVNVCYNDKSFLKQENEILNEQVAAMFGNDTAFQAIIEAQEQIINSKDKLIDAGKAIVDSDQVVINDYKKKLRKARLLNWVYSGIIIIETFFLIK